MAVVMPHPGQITAKVARIGHCQPPIPVIDSMSWAAPKATKIQLNHRLYSKGASTGLQNHMPGRNICGSLETLVFFWFPYAGLYVSAILAISTCNNCSGQPYSYFRYRPLCQKLKFFSGIKPPTATGPTFCDLSQSRIQSVDRLSDW